MGKPRISLCLIARNEEALLPACLASAREAVDEVVLVDTGSADRTREIARGAGATVLERPWDDDFAAPRNLAAAHATGDWILQLDADEQLAPGTGPTLRRLLDHAAFDVGQIRCHNADAPDAPVLEVLSGARRIGQPGLIPRVIRRAPGLRWEGCIHESVLEWVAARGGRIAPLAIDLAHYGYTDALLVTKDKRERNLALLRKRAREMPDDAVSLGYLAAELLAGGRIEEAADVAEQGWALLPRQPRYRSMRRLGVVRASAAVRRKRPEVALESVRGCVERGEQNPDLSFYRGCALEQLADRAESPADRAERLAEAERSYVEALAFLERGGFEQVMHATAPDVSLRLGVVRLRTGKPAEALASFARARGAVGAEKVALGEAEALLALSRPGDALRALEPAMAASGPEPWLLAARAAQALGAAADAKLFLAKAQRGGR